MSGEIAVAELKPGRAAKLAQGLHKCPGLVTASPARLRICDAGERIHDSVEIGRDHKAEMLEVVGRIADDDEIARRQNATQPQGQLGAADAARQGQYLRRGGHLNKSSS